MVSPEFTSRLLNSLGMGNDLCLLSELKFILSTGMYLPPLFLDELMLHALSLVEKEESAKKETPNEVLHRRHQQLSVTAMLNVLTDAFCGYRKCPSQREVVGGATWTPSFALLDRLLGEVLLCTCLRYRPLTTSGFGSGSVSVSGNKSLSGRQGRSVGFSGAVTAPGAEGDFITRVPPVSPNLPYLLTLLRFATRHYSPSSSPLPSGSPPAVVTINMPVPSPDALDLGKHSPTHHAFALRPCILVL